MPEVRKRHCWECRRRCLVCDSTEPACKRCSKSGTVCPGYSDVRPARLRWLAPGKTTARPWKSEKATSDATESEDGQTWPRAAAEHPSRTSLVIIPRLDMCTEAGAVEQGAAYFNACIYQDLIPINQLGKSRSIYPLLPTHVQKANMSPAYLHYGMVCMTLSHRMNRVRDQAESKALTEKFYRYRGVAIRSLNEHICTDNKRTEDLVIAGVLTLLLVDAQQGVSLHWRWHLKGIQTLVALRGGFHALSGLQRLEPLFSIIWLVAVFGNTTCPTSDLAMTKSHLDALPLILDKYGTAMAPFDRCPPLLFVEIIKINHLRHRATKRPTRADQHSQDALEILDRVHGFSSEQWAMSKPSSVEDWMLLGDAYQLAVALYCILSLQSQSILADTPPLRAMCASHSRRLRTLLEIALASPRIKRYMLWPLVVLGVEAVNGDAGMRSFVMNRLPELSRDGGTYSPLTARCVLASFWASGETRWEACFDMPYAFTMHIAVDVGQILPRS